MNVRTHFNLLWTDVYLSHAPFVDKYLQQKYKKKNLQKMSVWFAANWLKFQVEPMTTINFMNTYQLFRQMGINIRNNIIPCKKRGKRKKSRLVKKNPSPLKKSCNFSEWQVKKSCFDLKLTRINAWNADRCVFDHRAKWVRQLKFHYLHLSNKWRITLS